MKLPLCTPTDWGLFNGTEMHGGVHYVLGDLKCDKQTKHNKQATSIHRLPLGVGTFRS
jgi:hypothetical protein